MDGRVDSGVLAGEVVSKTTRVPLVIEGFAVGWAYLRPDGTFTAEITGDSVVAQEVRQMFSRGLADCISIDKVLE